MVRTKGKQQESMVIDFLNLPGLRADGKSGQMMWDSIGFQSAWISGSSWRDGRQPFLTQFASVTSSACAEDTAQGTGFKVNGVTNARQSMRIGATYDEIDLERKGYISVQDLEAFAKQHDYPVDYCSVFIHEARYQTRNVGETSNGSSYLSKASFVAFVRSREVALEKVFRKLDSDKDGYIDASDLLLGLKYVNIKCPMSRCQYRQKEDAILDFFGKIDYKGNMQVTLSDFRRFFLLLPSDKSMACYWLSSRTGSLCDVAQNVSLQDERKRGDPWGHLLAGATAGAVSRTATAPMETVRLLAMTGSIPAQLPLNQAANEVIRRSGWRGLFRGNRVNVLKSAPQKALDFFAFDRYKQFLTESVPGMPRVVAVFSAAGLAGLSSSVVLYPLEVVRTRMSLDFAGEYRGVAQTVKLIVRREGAAALYKGFVPSAAAILPEAAITYGLFDQLKALTSHMTGKPNAGVVPNLLCGVTAAFTGQLVAYPLETVSRRMQIAQGPANATDILVALLKEGGVRRLYRGVGASSLRVLPMAVVSFGTYELVRAMITRAQDYVDSQNMSLELRKGWCKLTKKGCKLIPVEPVGVVREAA